jgi:hypothetical protein
MKIDPQPGNGKKTVGGFEKRKALQTFIAAAERRRRGRKRSRVGGARAKSQDKVKSSFEE